jgi:formate dehydrogenase maturation protein FdhE
MNRLAAAVSLVMLSLAACGGGDAPTKADYAADLERICKSAEKRAAEAGQNADSAGEIADAVDEVIDDTRASLEDLKDVEKPDGDAGELAQRFVDATVSDAEEKGIPALENLRDALRAKDEKAAQQAVKRLQQIEQSDADELARELGADACASSGSA